MQGRAIRLSFKIKTRVVIARVAATAAILALLDYNVIYPYVAFTVPIQNSVYKDPTFAHLDMVPVGTPTHPYFMKGVRHNDLDDSLAITFNGTYVGGAGHSKSLEYANNYPVNSAFVFGCVEAPDITYLSFNKYPGTANVESRKYIQFWH